MRFRPCIDIHNGKVKQIVGGSLKDQGNQASENFVSEQDASYYAQLYEEQGLARTSVKDISERCGVARSLFYHYFPDKQAVTSAVIDDFITDYLESVQLWDEARTPGDIEQALDGVV